MKENDSLKLIMLFPLFFIFMPRPDIPGAQFMTYPILALIFGFISLLIIHRVGIQKSTIFTILLIVLSMCCMALSIFANSDSLSSLTHLAKPILFLTIFVFGSLVGRLKGRETVFRGLLKTAYVVLAAQVIVSGAQLLNINILDFIYSDEKASVNLLRVTGTLANPNLFAWIIIQMAVIIYLFETKKLKKFIWLIVAFALVFVSGSRSSLLIFPAVILVTYVIRNRKSTSFFIFKLPFFVVVLGTLAILGYNYLVANAMKYPYLSQILKVFETGDLSSVQSFETREIVWGEAIRRMHGISDWLFGLGPGNAPILDSDYLYSLINYGLIFLVINYLIYFVFLIYFFKCKDRLLMALGIQYILFSFLIGYQSETLTGWNYPLLLMFYGGITLSLKAKWVSVVEEEIVKVPRKRGIKIGRKRLVW